MVQRRDAHAPRVGAVDPVVGSQRHHLGLGQARVAEHAHLGGDESHVLDPSRLQRRHEAAPQLLDPVAHLGELLLPSATQLLVPQHGGHQCGAVGGGVGVVRADADLELRQHPPGGVRRRGDHRQRADALAVEAERLRERGGDEELQAGGQELSDDRAVLLDAEAEALVRHVEEGHQIALAQHLDDLIPLGGGEVVAGGVVAAGVQHHDGARLGALEVGQHPVDVDALQRGLVVAVAVHPETRAREQRAVVLPARVGDQDGGRRLDLLEQVRAHLQCAGAAERLDGRDPALDEGLGIRPEHQRPHGLTVGGHAVDAEVALRRRLGRESLLSRPDALQQGQLAAVVEVDTHPEVDLLRPLIGDEGLGEAENGVCGGELDTIEQRHGGTSFLGAPA